MWKTLIGYICFEECIDQIEKKRNFIIKKRLIHQELINKQRNMDEYCFYKEQIKIFYMNIVMMSLKKKEMIYFLI